MNRFLLLTLFSASILQSMEGPNKIVIKLNQEEKLSEADKALHDFAKQPLKPYGQDAPWNDMEVLHAMYEMRNQSAFAEAQKTISSLLKTGAQINSMDPLTKKTPLHLASEANNGITMQVLLEHGADPNLRDKESKTPYMDKINNRTDGAITLPMKLLFDHGARLDLFSKNQSIRLYFSDIVVREKIREGDLSAIKKLIDQGMGPFLTWNHLLEPVQWYNSHLDARSILETLLAHPLPGAVWEAEKITQHAQSWLTFLCIFKKQIPIQKPPRDVRVKIRNLVFTSLDHFIEQMPTKNLSQYTWIFGKEKLLKKLVERHLICFRDLKPNEMVDQHFISEIPEQVKSFFDPEEREAIIKPLLEKSYEHILTSQETKTT